MLKKFKQIKLQPLADGFMHGLKGTNLCSFSNLPHVFCSVWLFHDSSQCSRGSACPVDQICVGGMCPLWPFLDTCTASAGSWIWGKFIKLSMAVSPPEISFKFLVSLSSCFLATALTLDKT